MTAEMVPTTENRYLDDTLHGVHYAQENETQNCSIPPQPLVIKLTNGKTKISCPLTSWVLLTNFLRTV